MRRKRNTIDYTRCTLAAPASASRRMSPLARTMAALRTLLTRANVSMLVINLSRLIFVISFDSRLTRAMAFNCRCITRFSGCATQSEPCVRHVTTTAPIISRTCARNILSWYIMSTLMLCQMVTLAKLRGLREPIRVFENRNTWVSRASFFIALADIISI